MSGFQLCAECQLIARDTRQALIAAIAEAQQRAQHEAEPFLQRLKKMTAAERDQLAEERSTTNF